MTNLTISIDEDILKQARLRALQHGTSVNALVKDYLLHYVNEEQHYQQVTRNLIKLAKQSKAASHSKKWTRDELYER